MRILVCTHAFPEIDDPSDPNAVHALAQAMATNVDVTVLALSHTSGNERGEKVDLVRFAPFMPREALRAAEASRPSIFSRVLLFFLMFSEARAIRRLLREHTVDVVHSHGAFPHGIAATLAHATGGHFRHIATVHGRDTHLLRHIPFGRALAGRLAKHATRIVTPSAPVAQEFDARLGFASGASIQPMGIHTRPLREGKTVAASPFQDGYLLTFGPLTRASGTAILLQALVGIRRKHPSLGLVVVGDGPDGKALSDFARTLGIDNGVLFAGRRTREAVSALLRGASAVVVPALAPRDGVEPHLPTVVGEALAVGAKLVATRAGAIPDVLIANENAWLAEPGDVRGLAQQILAAIEAPTPPPHVAAMAEQLDWSRIAKLYLTWSRSVEEPAATPNAHPPRSRSA